MHDYRRKYTKGILLHYGNNSNLPATSLVKCSRRYLDRRATNSIGYYQGELVSMTINVGDAVSLPQSARISSWLKHHKRTRELSNFTWSWNILRTICRIIMKIWGNESLIIRQKSVGSREGVGKHLNKSQWVTGLIKKSVQIQNTYALFYAQIYPISESHAQKIEIKETSQSELDRPSSRLETNPDKSGGVKAEKEKIQKATKRSIDQGTRKLWIAWRHK